MDLPFWHLWFCIVNCPCKAEVMHWSPSLHKADTEFLRKFGVSACSISKVILKISSVTSLLQYSCWEPTIHCRFINTLLRYDLLWWFAPEKNCVVLAAFWDKKSIFHLGQKEHWSAHCDGPFCAQHYACCCHLMLCYLVQKTKLNSLKYWDFQNLKLVKRKL